MSPSPSPSPQPRSPSHSEPHTASTALIPVQPAQPPAILIPSTVAQFSLHRLQTMVLDPSTSKKEVCGEIGRLVGRLYKAAEVVMTPIGMLGLWAEESGFMEQLDPECVRVIRLAWAEREKKSGGRSSGQLDLNLGAGWEQWLEELRLLYIQSNPPPYHKEPKEINQWGDVRLGYLSVLLRKGLGIDSYTRRRIPNVRAIVAQVMCYDCKPKRNQEWGGKLHFDAIMSAIEGGRIPIVVEARKLTNLSTITLLPDDSPALPSSSSTAALPSSFGGPGSITSPIVVDDREAQQFYDIQDDDKFLIMQRKLKDAARAGRKEMVREELRDGIEYVSGTEGSSGKGKEREREVRSVSSPLSDAPPAPPLLPTAVIEPADMDIDPPQSGSTEAGVAAAAVASSAATGDEEAALGGVLGSGVAGKGKGKEKERAERSVTSESLSPAPPLKPNQPTEIASPGAMMIDPLEVVPLRTAEQGTSSDASRGNEPQRDESGSLRVPGVVTGDGGLSGSKDTSGGVAGAGNIDDGRRKTRNMGNPPPVKTTTSSPIVSKPPRKKSSKPKPTKTKTRASTSKNPRIPPARFSAMKSRTKKPKKAYSLYQMERSRWFDLGKRRELKEDEAEGTYTTTQHLIPERENGSNSPPSYVGKVPTLNLIRNGVCHALYIVRRARRNGSAEQLVGLLNEMMDGDGEVEEGDLVEETEAIRLENGEFEREDTFDADKQALLDALATGRPVHLPGVWDGQTIEENLTEQGITSLQSQDSGKSLTVNKFLQSCPEVGADPDAETPTPHSCLTLYSSKAKSALKEFGGKQGSRIDRIRACFDGSYAVSSIKSSVGRHPQLHPNDESRRTDMIHNLEYQIASTGCTFTGWHSDGGGTITFNQMLNGSKIWVFRVGRRVDLVILRPGDLFVMPAGLSHSVYTSSPAVCYGGHDYSLFPPLLRQTRDARARQRQGNPTNQLLSAADSFMVTFGAIWWDDVGRKELLERVLGGVKGRVRRQAMTDSIAADLSEMVGAPEGFLGKPVTQLEVTGNKEAEQATNMEVVARNEVVRQLILPGLSAMGNQFELIDSVGLVEHFVEEESGDEGGDGDSDVGSGEGEPGSEDEGQESGSEMSIDEVPEVQVPMDVD